MLDLSEPQLSWKVGRFRDTDEEYIERIRRTVNWWTRWRWVLLACSVGLTAAVIGFAFYVDATLPKFVRGGNEFEFALWLGLIVGVKFGLGLQGALWGIFQSLSSFRTERLLLRHVDQQRDCEKSQSQ